MSSTYSDVDRSADPQAAVRDQNRVDAWPAIRAYKARTYELLAGAAPVLDVGCGPGRDVAAIGRGRCVGLDPSRAMCSAAAAFGATVAAGDAHRLPFADGRFGGVRADRVVQHLADPATAIGEMVRVTRPGGRLVIADPDQESLVIRVPQVPRALTDRLKVFRRDVGYRNGTLVSSLPSHLASMGLADISVDAFALVLTDPDDAFGLPGWPHLWRACGHELPEGDLDGWDDAIARARDRGFVYALTYFVVAAVRP